MAEYEPDDLELAHSLTAPEINTLEHIQRGGSLADMLSIHGPIDRLLAHECVAYMHGGLYVTGRGSAVLRAFRAEVVSA